MRRYSPSCLELEFSEVHIQDPAYPHPDTPRITPPDTPHSPAPLELVTPMDRYARWWMLLPATNICSRAMIRKATPQTRISPRAASGRCYGPLSRRIQRPAYEICLVSPFRW